MASNFGANYTNIFQTSPSVKVDVTDWHARVRVMFDTFVQPAVALAIGDLIFMGRLPPGAKIVDACLVCTDFGATGLVDVGYQMADRSLSASDVPNGIFSQANINTAAVSVYMNDAVAGSFHAPAAGLAGDADVVIKVTTATDATGGTLSLQVLYVID